MSCLAIDILTPRVICILPPSPWEIFWIGASPTRKSGIGGPLGLTSGLLNLPRSCPDVSMSLHVDFSKVTRWVIFSALYALFTFSSATVHLPTIQMMVSNQRYQPPSKETEVCWWLWTCNDPRCLFPPPCGSCTHKFIGLLSGLMSNLAIGRRIKVC